MKVFGRFSSVNFLHLTTKKVVAATALLGLLVSTNIVSNRPAITLATAGSPTTSTVQTQSKKTSHKAAKHAAVKTVAQTTASCEKPSIPKLTPLALTSASAKLVQRVETPKTYAVHGNSRDQLRLELAKCAPTNGQSTQQYLADTSYSLSWRFDMEVGDDGLCHVAAPKVGLVIRQVLPVWDNSNPELSQTWQTFMLNLKTHEDGHSQLGQQYAKQVLSLLESSPAAPSCAALKTKATAVVNSKLAALKQANVTYDQQTNHGATQGATF